MNNTPHFIVTQVFDFRSRRFRDKAFRSERGARAALSRANRQRSMLGIREQSIWWRDGKPEEVAK